MVSPEDCRTILKDFAKLHLSRQKEPDLILSDQEIVPLAKKVSNLIRDIKIRLEDDPRKTLPLNPEAKIVFDYLVYPLAKEIIRQNIEELDDLIRNLPPADRIPHGNEPSREEELIGKKKWFELSEKSAWELFAALLGIKVNADKFRIKLFRDLTRFWDRYKGG